MPLETYEDFQNLSKQQLVDFLSVRGMKTTGSKVILVGRALTAVELNMQIISTTEEQKQKLLDDYKALLKELKIDNPFKVPKMNNIMMLHNGLV